MVALGRGGRSINGPGAAAGGTGVAERSGAGAGQ